MKLATNLQDFPEDADQENGNYANLCLCGQTFIGNKHRIICKLCDNRDKEFDRLASSFCLKLDSPAYYNARMFFNAGHKCAGHVKPIERRVPYSWCTAVINACAAAHVVVQLDNPKKTLDNLIEMNVNAALGPIVSSYTNPE